MKIKLSYQSESDIPEGMSALYTERDGSWVLTGVEGMKSQGDIDRLQESLAKERSDHKETKAKLRSFNGLDADEVLTKLDKYDELEKLAEGNNPEKLEEIVAARLKSVTNPLERQIAKLTEERDGAVAERDQLKTANQRRTKNDLIRTAAQDAKVNAAMLDDVIQLAGAHLELNDAGDVVSTSSSPTGEGLSLTEYFAEVQEARRHWWPASDGDGAGGNGGNGPAGNNPFSKDNWNLTEQGKLVSSNPEKAAALAKAAGTTVGGLRPE